MKALVISIFIAIIMATAEAQDLSAALSSLPECAQRCVLPVIASLPCNISTIQELADCFCPDVDARSNTSTCVQEACGYSDQLISDKRNYVLCQSYPSPSRSAELERTAIILIGVSLVFVLLRAWSRMITAKKFWWDDWMIFVAALFLYVTLALEIPSSSLGFGLHSWAVNPANISTLLKLFYTTSLTYITTQIMTKISLLTFYLRVFPHQTFRFCTYATIAFILVHGLMFMLLIAFQCLPIQSIWDLSVPKTCVDQTAVAYAGAAFSIFEDLTILALPIPCVAGLRMGRGKRISLIVMFSVGSFACITSMIRLNHLSSYGGIDQTWDNLPVAFWSIIEISTAVICACLPSLKPLLARYLPKLFGSSIYGTGTGGGLSNISMQQQPRNKKQGSAGGQGGVQDRDVERGVGGLGDEYGHVEDVETVMAVGVLKGGPREGARTGNHSKSESERRTPSPESGIRVTRGWSDNESDEGLVGARPGVHDESVATAAALPTVPGESWGWLPKSTYNGEQRMI